MVMKKVPEVIARIQGFEFPSELETALLDAFDKSLDAFPVILLAESTGDLGHAELMTIYAWTEPYKQFIEHVEKVGREKGHSGRGYLLSEEGGYHMLVAVNETREYLNELIDKKSEEFDREADRALTRGRFPTPSIWKTAETQNMQPVNGLAARVTGIPYVPNKPETNRV